MIILIAISLLSIGLSLIALYKANHSSQQLQDLIGEEIDAKKLLHKLKIHQLRQKDLKRLIDALNEKQTADHKLLQTSLRKTGLVRFNPYRDTGGDQSFSLCLLDSDNNGFILTTIHGREGTRVYAKPITAGVSQYDLSSEEKSALKKATN